MKDEIIYQKKRLYAIGMSEGWVLVSFMNLILFFTQGNTNFFKSFLIGSNVTIILCGVGLYLYWRYLK